MFHWIKRAILIFSFIAIWHSSLLFSEENFQNRTKDSFEFSFTIGVGFLYFNHIKGNLSPIPIGSFNDYAGVNFGNVGSFSYNKTPVYEVLFLKRVFSFLKCGLSLNGQSGVCIQSSPQNYLTTSGNSATAQFRSNLQIYSIMFKAFVQAPPLSIPCFQISPYLGAGVGPSWQTFSNISIYESIVQNGEITTTLLTIRQKINACASWAAEAGFSLRPKRTLASMEIRLGCKYIDWGPARQMGLLKDQRVKVGPFKPIEVKKIYSFAPYIGINWCF